MSLFRAFCNDMTIVFQKVCLRREQKGLLKLVLQSTTKECLTRVGFYAPTDGRKININLALQWYTFEVE